MSDTTESPDDDRRERRLPAAAPAGPQIIDAVPVTEGEALVVESFLRNCAIFERGEAERPLFIEAPGIGVFARLDGYAVLPVETLRAIAAKADVTIPGVTEIHS